MPILYLTDLRKQVLKAAREEAFGVSVVSTLDGECLARARLTVGKNRAVVPHEALIYNSSANLLKYVYLCCLLTCHIIECEIFIGGKLTDVRCLCWCLHASAL